VTFLPFLPLLHKTGSLTGRQAVKKSARKQSINDLPPLAFPSLAAEEHLAGGQLVENSSSKADLPSRSTRGTGVSIFSILAKQWEASRPSTQRKRIQRLGEKIKVLRDFDTPPANLRALIDSLPIPKGEKATLVKFLEGRPEPGSKAYWKLEHQFQEVQKHLVEINDKSPNEAIQQYLNLILQRMYQGPEIGLHAHFVNIEMRDLRRRWEKDKDTEALGEAIRALEAEKGAPLEDPQEIVEAWIRRAILEVAKEPLPRTGSGRRKMPLEEKEEIIADCKKWRPTCEGLNGEFKKGKWKEKKLEVSELTRKEKRGELAEKYDIPVADVEAIEWFLEHPSGRSKKSTPTQAMCHMVARLHPTGIGAKTVETIWLTHLNAHPDKKRKRKTLTTPVAERTV
jgi:hypothetical protein